jgi:hypothetical protein
LEKILNEKSFNNFFLHLWVVELTYICHRYQLHPAVLGSKFTASVVDTGGKYSTGVVDTGGAP